MRGALVWIVAAALGAGCSGQERRAEQAEQHREEARQALVRGDRLGALRALERLRAGGTRAPEERLELARLLVAAGEAPEAAWLLEEGVRRHPARDDLRLALGQVALLVGNPASARAALEPIAPESEQHVAARVLLAQAELRLGDLERALAILVETERLYPDQPEARLARIATLLSERRFEEARSALDEARAALAGAEERPRLRRLEVAFHQLQAAQGELEPAIAGLGEIVESEPGDVQAWQALVQALARAGRVEDALGQVRAALEEDPERLALYPLLASLHAALGSPDDAERALRSFLERSPSPTAYSLLVQLHASRNQEDAGLATLREALEQFPDDRLLRRAYAETLLWFGHDAEGRREVERFRSDFPDDPYGEYLLARLDLARGDAATAARRLERLMPSLDQAATQYWLGHALETLGDRVGAERRYALALNRDPSDPALYPPLIRLAEARGDWRSVAGTARLLNLRAPGLYDGCAALAAALVNLGEGEAAERVARQCLERFPERVEGRLLLAGALRAQGRTREALEQLDEARRQAGRNPEFEAEHALTLGMAGRVEEGVARAREALRDHPDVAALHATLAALLFQLGRADEGTRAVDRALELAPEDPNPLKLRARFRAATGRLEGALADCDRYLARRPDDPTVHFIRGAVQARRGETEAAITSYRRAAELDERAFAPRNNLAELLAERDLDEALAVAQQAYALAPQDSHVLDTLGWLYLEKGLVERAISLLEDAHSAAPSRTEPQLHLALAYRKAGRPDEARRLLSALRERVEGEELARVDQALRSLP